MRGISIPGLFWMFLALVGAASLVSGALAGPADSSQLDPTKPIFGFLDPQTRIFTAAPLSVPEVAAATAVVVRKGTLIIKGIISLNAATPASATITADGSFALSDARFSSSALSTGTATRTGHTASVTITLNYEVAALSASEKMAVTLTIDSSAPQNSSVQLVQSIVLPANGATTTVTFPASM